MPGATKHCVYGLCTSDSREGLKTFDPSVKFFKFPKPCLLFRKSEFSFYWKGKRGQSIPGRQKFEREHMEKCEECRMCYRWVLKCKRKDGRLASIGDIKKDMYICSKHFPEGTLAVDVRSNLPGDIVKARKSPLKRNTAHAYTSCGTSGNIAPSTLVTSDLNTSTSTDYENATMDLETTSAPLVQWFEQSTQTASVMMADQSIQAAAAMKRAATQTGCSSVVRSCATQTNETSSYIEKLEQENIALKSSFNSVLCKLNELEKQDRTAPMVDFQLLLMGDDDVSCFYTMFTYQQLEGLVAYFTNGEVIDRWGKGPVSGKGAKLLTPIQELILTLLRLRSGFLVRDLACRFGISTGLVSETVATWVLLMYNKFDSLRPYMIPTREKIQETLPERFQNMRNLRVIVDGAEFFCETPSHFGQQSNTYSQYKAHSTHKILLGCTPTGSICFVSEAFEGSISDRQLVIESGLLECLDKHDMILADRGFTIKDLTDNKDITLNIPSFLHGRNQLTPQEEVQTRLVAKNRIFIEHSVRRIKEFRLFQRVLPLSMRHLLSQIIFVCACLTNFQKPLEL